MARFHPSSYTRARLAEQAYALLQSALACATEAGCRQLIPRIRYALKSAEGAKRHAYLRTVRLTAEADARERAERACACTHDQAEHRQGTGACGGRYSCERPGEPCNCQSFTPDPAGRASHADTRRHEAVTGERGEGRW